MIEEISPCHCNVKEYLSKNILARYYTHTYKNL